MWRIVDPMPLASSSSTETNATFENRGTHTESPATRRPAGRLAHRMRSPTRPPSQIEPETRCSQSNASESPRGAVWAACPASPGMSSAEAAAASAPVRAKISAIERCSRWGRSTQSAIAPAAQKRAMQISRSTYARPNAVTRNSGTSAPTSNTERSESTAVSTSR